MDRSCSCCKSRVSTKTTSHSSRSNRISGSSIPSSRCCTSISCNRSPAQCIAQNTRCRPWILEPARHGTEHQTTIIFISKKHNTINCLSGIITHQHIAQNTWTTIIEVPFCFLVNERPHKERGATRLSRWCQALPYKCMSLWRPHNGMET
jgi:hypothetical protein